MTDQEIVDKANALARKFYSRLGYSVRKGYRFDRAHHPQELAQWTLAAIAFAELLATDIDDALSNLDE